MLVQHLHVRWKMLQLQGPDLQWIPPQLKPQILVPGQAGSASHICPSVRPKIGLFLQTAAAGMDVSVMDAPWDGLPVRSWARGDSGRERSLIKCRCSQRWAPRVQITPDLLTSWPSSLKPCQSSSAQIQTYRSHTSVPGEHPAGFWAPVPVRGDGDAPPEGTSLPQKRSTAQ